MEKKKSSYIVSGNVLNKLVKPLCGTVWKFLRKLKIEIPNDPDIPALAIHPYKNFKKNTCTPIFIAALFPIAMTWEKIYMSIGK